MISTRVLVLVMAAAPLCCSPAQAQTCDEPQNERCDGAIEFTFAELPLAIEGVLGCENNMVDRPYFDLFYRYDCTVSGDYMFDMCGSFGDTYMRVYTGGCGFFPATSWVEDDDSCPGVQSPVDPMITTRLDAGTSYWIEIGAWRPDEAFPPNANDPFLLNISYLGVCRADLNLDGVADFFDVEMFVRLFIEGDPAADFDGDGTIGFFDLMDFLTIFQLDCG